jgi:hypothetical protein
MQSKTALGLLAALACPLVFGCSSSVSTDGKPAASSSAALRRTQSCEDLTSALRADARSKVNSRIDAEVRAIREGYTKYFYGPERGGIATTPTLNAGPGVTMDAAPQAPAGASAAANPAHSETETQVKGVD